MLGTYIDGPLGGEGPNKGPPIEIPQHDVAIARGSKQCAE